MKVEGMYHVGFTVSDIERSIELKSEGASAAPSGASPSRGLRGQRPRSKWTSLTRVVKRPSGDTSSAEAPA
jgi:hypothetical protein